MDVSTLIILASLLAIGGGLYAAARLIFAELIEEGRLKAVADEQRRKLDELEQRAIDNARAGETRHEMDRADFNDVVDRL